MWDGYQKISQPCEKGTRKKTSQPCEKGTRKKPVMHVERVPEKMEQLNDLSLLLIITKINVMYL